MRHIVVGVDESTHAAEALRWAVREAKLHDARVTAVLAWGFLDQHHTIVGERFDPSYTESDALAALEAFTVAAVGDQAAAVESRVVCDLPARALLEASEGSDLLVVGARGIGGFRGLLLGSVSQHCLHHTRTPIAIIRQPPGRPVAERERILVAVDGSETAQRALRWAVDEGRARHGTVIALHAWSSPYRGVRSAGDPSADRYESASRELIDEAIAAAVPHVLATSIQRQSMPGGAAKAILTAAEDAEIVVMGSRGLGGFKGMLLGSVTDQVSRHAPCPVVVLPPDTTP